MDHEQGRAAIRVLVVEDQPAVRQTLNHLLRAAGYAVDVTACGGAAIEAVRLRSYDLVLIDLGLPDIDGCTAVPALRAHLPRDRRIPIVALMARTGSGEAALCRTAGLDGYITKPFQPPKLLDEIRRWTRGWSASAQTHGHDPIWDWSLYREMADCLGPSRTETALDLFETHLINSLTSLRAAPGDASLLAREAHAFVSIAGMLGFRELAGISRAIMVSDQIASPQVGMAAFTAAAERVFACLRHSPHSTLA